MRAGVCWLLHFMNIHTAAGYMRHGYRVRRVSWDEFEYIYKDYYVGHMVMVPNGGKSKKKHPFYSDWHPEPNDLLADDWELILEGIVTDFPVTYSD